MSSRSAELRRHRGLLLSCVIGLLLGTPFIPYLLGPLAGLFVKEYGWTLPDVIRLLAFQSAGMTLGLPVAGMLADRVAPRPLILATTATLAVLAMSIPAAARHGYPSLCTLFFALGFLAAGLSGLYFARVVGAVFDSARGFALGATLSGAGLAGFVAPLYAQAIASRFDLAAVFFGAGSLMLLVSLPIVAVGLARAPHPIRAETAAVTARGMSLREAMRDRRFFLMLAPLLAFGLIVSSLLVSIVPALVDRGVTARTAAVVASLYGIATVAGRLGSGWLLDRFRPARVGVGLFSIAAIGTLGFQTAGTPGAVVATVAAGFVNGAEIDLLSYMTVRYFGIRHYGRIFGFAYAVYMGASVIGPFFAAGLMQRGGHALLYLAASGLLALSALVLVALARFEGRPYAETSDAVERTTVLEVS